MDIQTGNVFRENQYGRNTEQISTTNNLQSVPKTENPLSSLVEGQYFRGTILDVQGESLVKILFGENQQLNATLAGNMQLNIGEKVIFQVKENSGGKIVLSPTTYGDGAEQVVSRALLGAGLPETDRNIVLVKELMNYGQPIDKESLNNLFKAAKEFKTTAVNVLVQMNAHDIKLSEENIRQFEQYKNMEYKVNERISDISDNLLEVAKNISENSESQVSELTDILTTILDLTAVDEPQEEAGILPENNKGVTVESSPFYTTQENITAAPEESQEMVVKEPVKEFADNLLDMVKQANTSKDMSEVISFINENISSKEELAEVINSKELGEIIREKFVSKFTINPKQLSEEPLLLKEKVDKIYERLTHLGEEISKSFDNSKNIFDNLNNSNQNLKDNLNFMTYMNNLSSFVQIPVKLSGEEADAELYVYNKNRGKVKEGDTLTAFLHLDMESLGATDVNISLTGKNVSIRFQMEDGSSARLVEKHISELSDRLNEQGFYTNLEVRADKNMKKKSPVDNICEADEGAVKINRYLFDIRT